MLLVTVTSSMMTSQLVATRQFSHTSGKTTVQQGRSPSKQCDRTFVQGGRSSTPIDQKHRRAPPASIRYCTTARNRACITQLSAALFRQLGHPNPNHTAQNSHIHTQRREARVKPQTPVHDVIIWATDNIAHRAGACGERKQGRVLLTSVSCRSQTDTMPSNEANQTKLHQQCTHASHHILA